MSELEKEVRIKAFNLGVDLNKATVIVLEEYSKALKEGKDTNNAYDYVFGKIQERRT